MGGLETGAVGAMDLPGEMGGGGMHGLPFSESALDLVGCCSSLYAGRTLCLGYQAPHLRSKV